MANAVGRHIGFIKIKQGKTMSKETKLLAIVAGILEVGSVDLQTELNEGNWDSLAVLTFISDADAEFDIVVSSEKVVSVTSVAQLLKLI